MADMCGACGCPCEAVDLLVHMGDEGLLPDNLMLTAVARAFAGQGEGVREREKNEDRAVSTTGVRGGTGTGSGMVTGPGSGPRSGVDFKSGPGSGSESNIYYYLKLLRTAEVHRQIIILLLSPHFNIMLCSLR